MKRTGRMSPEWYLRIIGQNLLFLPFPPSSLSNVDEVQSYCSPHTWLALKDSRPAGCVTPGCSFSITTSTAVTLLMRYQLALLLSGFALDLEKSFFRLMGCVITLYLRFLQSTDLSSTIDAKLEVYDLLGRGARTITLPVVFCDASEMGEEEESEESESE